ncbi:hypothetical protein ACKWTF_010746 [Chironomus riparius]
MAINFLFIILAVQHYFAHPIENTLECYFDDEKVVTISGYSCILTDINVNVTKQTQKISITGIHNAEKSNNDVVNIKIINSHTPFIVPEILTEFPYIEGLEVRKCSLKRIQAFVLSTAPSLRDVIIVDNNIPTLEHGAFEGLENLQNLLLISNHIENIEAGAFFGLEQLNTLWLTHNRFTNLPPTTFGSLINLRKLFITHSYLTRIDSQMIRNSTQLQQLGLSDNKINEIESTFIDELRSLKLLKLKDNVCVDEDFADAEKKIHKEDINEALDKCFDNFVAGDQKNLETPENSIQKIVLEIQGKFTIYSENGDVIYSN